MRVVVADATPLNYLVIIGAVVVLPRLFERIHIPAAVRDELTRQVTPDVVRTWMQQSPGWLEIFPATLEGLHDPALSGLDAGERAAIQLGESIRADLLLMDDRVGAYIAQQRGFAVTGTLGILDLASRAGLLKLKEAFARLQATNFRYPPSLLEALLAEEGKRNRT